MPHRSSSPSSTPIPPPSLALLSRGVHEAPYTIDGAPVLIAVNSRHERIAEMPVHEPDERLAVIAQLHDALDYLDPRPPIRLVTD